MPSVVPCLRLRYSAGHQRSCDMLHHIQRVASCHRLQTCFVSAAATESVLEAGQKLAALRLQPVPRPRGSECRCGTLVCVLVRHLQFAVTLSMCSPRSREMVTGLTWRGTTSPSFSHIWLVSVSCLLLCARPCLWWILPRLLLAFWTRTSTCEELIGFTDRDQLPQSS